MASILRVNTLTDASSNNSTAMSTVFNGTAKAYLTYNNAGSIQDSFNIGSVTDAGTGEYVTVFTSNLSNANYVTAGTTMEEMVIRQFLISSISRCQRYNWL